MSAQAQTPGPAAGLGAKAPPLGISANSFAQRGAGKTKTTRPAARAARFGILRTAQRLLNESSLTPKEQHRTVWCHRQVPDLEANVRIYRARDGSDASVHGLMTCGSVWTCPVCAARVSEARRQELNLAMVRWLERGRADDGAQRNGAYLLTLTFSHAADDLLPDLLLRQSRALATFKASRAYRETWERHRRAGSIRGLEITHGRNGWHPHTHDLVLAGAGLLEDKGAIRDLKRAWLWSAIRAGLLPGVSARGRRRCRGFRLTLSEGGLAAIRNHWRHGLDLRGGERAAEYVAKFGKDEAWGITAELARSYAKVGVKASHWAEDYHATAFQLLVFAANGDAQAGALFRQFAAAMTGKRALSWSPGLKTALGIRDATDEELLGAPDEMPERYHAASLMPGEWGFVLSRNAVGELLEYCASQLTGDTMEDNQKILQELIDDLRRRPRQSLGHVVRRSEMEGLAVIGATQ